MAVYAYSKVAVYAALGGAVRPATLTRVLVTDTVTGDPVNVTQGTRTAPYLDTDANGVASFTAEHPGPLRLTTGATFMDVYSNELPGIALDAVTAAESAQAAALAAQTAAEGAASLVGAPADSAMALTAGNPASAFRGALDDVYATQAQITDALDAQDAAVGAALTAVQDAMATTEDLFVTHYRDASITAASGTTMTLLCCPFPLRLTSLTVTTWGMTNVPKSDTDWWLARLRYGNPTGPGTGTAIPVATKTTRATAGTEPAGEAMTAMVPWSFATTDLTTEYTAGQVINISWAKTGSPPDIVGPMVVTIGYRPL